MADNHQMCKRCQVGIGNCAVCADKSDEEVAESLRLRGLPVARPAALAGETRTDSGLSVDEAFRRAKENVKASNKEERKGETISPENASVQFKGMNQQDTFNWLVERSNRLAAAASRIAQRELDFTRWRDMAGELGIKVDALGVFRNARAETAEAALSQAQQQNDVWLEKWANERKQKSALMEALEPFANEYENRVNGADWENAARVYEQVKEKI